MTVEIRRAQDDEHRWVGDLLVRAYATLADRDEAYDAVLRDVAGRATTAEVLVATLDGIPMGTVTFVPGPDRRLKSTIPTQQRSACSASTNREPTAFLARSRIAARDKVDKVGVHPAARGSASTRHVRPATILAIALASLAGCGLAAIPGSVDDPPPDCLIPPGTEFAFAGETTLARLGLDDAGPYRNLPGTAYVTAEAIQAQGDPPERWWCIVFEPTAAAEEMSMSGVAAYGPLLNEWETPAVP